MIDFFTEQYKNTSNWHIFLEFIVFVSGILSVYFAKKENILVYPIGLIATTITVYLLYKAQYFADMSINIYFSIMSIYGWYNWKKKENEPLLKISKTTLLEKLKGFLLFISTIIFTYCVYIYFDYSVKLINYIDIFTSGIFFTAMWFMALKKIENWTLWIIGNLIAIPLFAYRGLGMLSLQYLIFTILAIMAYREWNKILQNKT